MFEEYKYMGNINQAHYKNYKYIWWSEYFRHTIVTYNVIFSFLSSGWCFMRLPPPPSSIIWSEWKQNEQLTGSFCLTSRYSCTSLYPAIWNLYAIKNEHKTWWTHHRLFKFCFDLKRINTITWIKDLIKVKTGWKFSNPKNFSNKTNTLMFFKQTSVKCGPCIIFQMVSNQNSHIININASFKSTLWMKDMCMQN